jgi:hypothetical protein
MATITRPTITRPTAAKRTGQPGSYFYAEYQHARAQQAMVRRDRLGRVLPRSLAKSVPVALLVSLVLAFGIHLPGAFAFGVFALIVVVWSGVVIVSAFGGDGELETLRANAEGERKTARMAARLRRAGWTVMHDLEVPSADAVVGNLLIGPTGVLVLTSDPTEGVVRYSKKVASVDGEPLTEAIERIGFLASQIRSDLQAAVPLIKLSVYPALVMVEADVLWKDGAVENVTIIGLRSLPDFARSRKGKLNPVEVKQVVAAARELFPPFVDRGIDAVTIDRDEWVRVMDLLNAIRERGGDASDLLPRVRDLEARLSRQADGFTRIGLGPDDADDADDVEPDDGFVSDALLGDDGEQEFMTSPPAPGHGSSAASAASAAGLRGSEDEGGGLIASFRPSGRARGRRPRPPRTSQQVPWTPGGGDPAGNPGTRPSLASVRTERETRAPRPAPGPETERADP